MRVASANAMHMHLSSGRWRGGERSGEGRRIRALKLRPREESEAAGAQPETSASIQGGGPWKVRRDVDQKDQALADGGGDRVSLKSNRHRSRGGERATTSMSTTHHTREVPAPPNLIRSAGSKEETTSIHCGPRKGTPATTATPYRRRAAIQSSPSSPSHYLAVRCLALPCCVFRFRLLALAPRVIV